MVNEVSPVEAFKMLQSDGGGVLLDVRSRVEFEYVGHPTDAVNVPWQDAPDWAVDPDFVVKVRGRLRELHGPNARVEELPVLALCRSGKRSMAAALALEEAGFKRVFNIAEGFEGERDRDGHRNTVNGWRRHGLPWVQS